MHSITIYHNPSCGTSRNTLELIHNSGIEPIVIHYLDNPPSRTELLKLIVDMGITVRELLRKNVEPYETLKLDSIQWSDDQLIDFMLEHPILINRPIVVTELGTKLCRPSEVVLDILPLPQNGAFTKEDGEPVISAEGKRIIK
ncbi:MULTISPECIES: glutaredoxin-dependent arsenate reductase [Providencia]|uniref:glutaredoxin-dependent arsenate reductase n=1 Tax=Providencia TaxID=586 RepID=UPI00083972F4|nr:MULTISPECIES: glutaredoxin-dependent arsenate reductase [Providencia]MBP6122815.1 glutaredoxin-dependent arsenate reductase [Providencia sp.]NIH22092.1 glutaredoxin-dependent arsenate reductase [Providencia heimbachae]